MSSDPEQMHMNHEHSHSDHSHHDMSSTVHMSHDGMSHHDMSQMSHGDAAGHDMANMPGMQMSGHDMAGHSGHDMHAHVARFRQLFWIMLALSIPVVALSHMFAMIVGYSLPEQTWLSWVTPVLGTVMYVWGGRPFLTGAVSEIRSRQPGMMLLIGLAITVAFVSSWLSTLHLLDDQLDFWWELALLIVIMLLGHWIEMRSLAQTSSALDTLAALLPDEAERVTGDTVERVAPGDLRVGDIVVIRPGGRVPADATVVEGSAAIDESMITGESATVRRTSGDHLVAGTVATDSGLRAQVTAVGEGTTLAGIRRLVAEAQSSTSRTQRLADRAAGWLFWFALGAAALTALVWSLIGQPDQAIVRTISVLVIACPHALGLAIPLVVSIATERAARSGVLISDRLALEAMRTVDTVLFDKTGTLTKGEPTVTALVAAPGFDAPVGTTAQDAVLALAAAAESDSEHPLARAIVAAAAARGLEVPAADQFSSSPAVGVVATVAVGGTPHRISVGGPLLLEQHHAEPLPDATTWGAAGTVLHVLDEDTVIGVLQLADGIRPESRAAVRQLHEEGVQVVMITGDAKPVADAVAAELGIDRVFAGVRPEQKAEKVAQLQREGRQVAMVGDGVNDAPALAAANVGIAIGAGTDVAIASAGVILASDDPRGVLAVRTLSEATYRKMRQNLWWAAGYNLISVPLAAGVLAPIGFVLPMSVGALLMSASTVVVALNAQLLRRVDLRPRD